MGDSIILSEIKRRKRLRKRAVKKEKIVQIVQKYIPDRLDTYRHEREEELKKFAKEHGIKDLDMDAIRHLGNVRRPLVLVRGKPITVEQAKELITGEEPLFGDGDDPRCCFDSREERGVLKNIFYRQGYSWLSTWV